MDIGVVFPQIEIGDDPEVVRSYARAVEGAGYGHLLAYDHVVGVNPDRPGWDGPYDYRDQFHEPLTLFAHLAAITDELELVTGILILPQRGTALVAKQAAQVDVLSSGRLRLGVGLGWNEPEYVALGQDFHTRGRRVEEQVEVLRALWTDDLVEYSGEFHEIPEVGIEPRPVQRPIPIWMGGMADPVLRRVARQADGWLPMFDPGSEEASKLDRLREYAREEGRDPDDVGIHGQFSAPPGEPGAWVERAEAWQEVGADHVSVNTMYHGLEGREHEEHLTDVAETLADAGFL